MSNMLIDYYKAIEDSSAKMLEAAKLKDWDGVVRYEGACAVLIEQLRFITHCMPCAAGSPMPRPKRQAVRAVTAEGDQGPGTRVAVIERARGSPGGLAKADGF